MSLNKQKLLADPQTGKDRSLQYPSDYNQAISDNLDHLLAIMLKVEALYGQSMVVASGWRPPSVNEHTSNAATSSNHLKGIAVDIQDLDGSVMKWVLANLSTLASMGLYFENFNWTPTWVHFQYVPPGSKHRIYVPSTAPAQCNRWNGQYDKSLDY